MSKLKMCPSKNPLRGRLGLVHILPRLSPDNLDGELIWIDEELKRGLRGGDTVVVAGTADAMSHHSNTPK